MTHHDPLQDRHRNGRGHRQARTGPRRHDARAVTNTLFTISSGVATFTGASSIPSSLLLGPGATSAKPTTQTHSSGLLTSGGASNTVTPTTTFDSTTPSQPSSSPSNTASSASTPSNNGSTGFASNHKLLLAGVIAGFLALVIVVCIVVWLLVRRARRRKQSDELARQSFMAGTLLNNSKGPGAAKAKEIIPMGEAALFKGHDRKKGSRADDWKGLGSRDDRYDPARDIANDASSMRSGGHRSPYIPPHQVSFGALLSNVQPGETGRPSVDVPPYTLTGAFAHALSAEDEDEREQSISHQSHLMSAGSPRIERGPQMRVPQTQAHPHPYADPSVLSSAVATHRAPPYLSSSNQSSPTRVDHEEQAFAQQQSASAPSRALGYAETPRAAAEDEPQRTDFLSLTPSSAPISDQPLHPSGRQDYFGNTGPSEGPSANVPPSPSSLYSQQSGIPPASINQPTKPGPVFSTTSRAALFAPSPSPSGFSATHVGLQSRPSAKPTKQERAMNMRALGDLIAALDGPEATSASTPSSSLSPSDALDHSRGRPMPNAGLWRAALGSSPTLGARQGSDSSNAAHKR